MTTTSSTAAPAKPVRPFGLRDKIGYAAGDFGNDMTFMIQAFFMLAYFTKVIGVHPAHVGLLVAVVRVMDAFTDVGMGRIVDSVKPAHDGKFKPWVRRIAIPVALSSALLFQPWVVNFPYAGKLAWLVVFYILWGSIFYTAINIPYGSMASVISDKAEDRAELSVWRSTGAHLAFLAVSFLLPMLVFEGKNINATKFGWTAVGMAALAVVFYAILYFNVEERVVVPPKAKEEKLTFGQLMGSLVTNRALLAIIVAALLLLLGNLFNGQVAAFLFSDYFGDGKLQGTVSLIAGLPPMLLVFFVAPLVSKFGKAELGIFGVGLYVVCMTANFLLKPAVGDTGAFVRFALLYVIAMFGLGIFNFLIWALIVDVIDYQEVRSNQRDDATVYAMYSWARKLGQAASAALGGVALGWIGYQQAGADGKPVEQTQETLDGIWMLFNAVPAVFLLGTFAALAFWYPLKKKMVAENQAVLAERRDAQGA